MCEVLEGSVSKCRIASEVSQTQQRSTKHTMASLCFVSYGGKTKIQIFFKILAFLSMLRIEMKIS